MAQTSDTSNPEFNRLIAELSAARRSGSAENQMEQQKALSSLDDLVSSLLAGSAVPDLENINQHLASLKSDAQSVGENYRLVHLDGNSNTFALVVNFGLSGPAAIRIYTRASNRYSLAAGIDRYSQKEFLDSDVELLPVSSPESIFVTISGRTDDRATGLFAAWRFDGRQITPLWNSDLLQFSSYEADGRDFLLTYCADPDDDHPEQCPRMVQDTYRWQEGNWKRTRSAMLGPRKVAIK